MYDYTYAVFRDNSHCAIRVEIARKYTYYIPMEAAEVRIVRADHADFASVYEAYDYPVRRAAEIFLLAPNKAVDPKARAHLESIIADPAFIYDETQYPPLKVKEEPKMATKKSAAAVADEVAKSPKPKSKKDALQAAGEASGGPVGAVKAAPAPKGKAAPAAKKAPAEKAPKAAKPKAAAKEKSPRAAALDTSARFKVGEGATRVRGGFMKEFLEAAQELEKGSRGRGFVGDELLEKAAGLPGAKDRDASWVRTYIAYGVAPAHGIFVPA